MCCCQSVQTQERDSFGHSGLLFATHDKTTMKRQIIGQSTENKIIILLLFTSICLSIKFSLDEEKTKDVTIYLSLHTKVNERLHLIKM